MLANILYFLQHLIDFIKVDLLILKSIRRLYIILFIVLLYLLFFLQFFGIQNIYVVKLTTIQLSLFWILCVKIFSVAKSAFLYNFFLLNRGFYVIELELLAYLFPFFLFFIAIIFPFYFFISDAVVILEKSLPFILMDALSIVVINFYVYLLIYSICSILDIAISFVLEPSLFADFNDMFVLQSLNDENSYFVKILLFICQLFSIKYYICRKSKL